MTPIQKDITLIHYYFQSMTEKNICFASCATMAAKLGLKDGRHIQRETAFLAGREITRTGDKVRRAVPLIEVLDQGGANRPQTRRAVIPPAVSAPPASAAAPAKSAARPPADSVQTPGGFRHPKEINQKEKKINQQTIVDPSPTGVFCLTSGERSSLTKENGRRIGLGRRSNDLAAARAAATNEGIDASDLDWITSTLRGVGVEQNAIAHVMAEDISAAYEIAGLVKATGYDSSIRDPARYYASLCWHPERLTCGDETTTAASGEHRPLAATRNGHGDASRRGEPKRRDDRDDDVDDRSPHEIAQGEARLAAMNKQLEDQGIFTDPISGETIINPPLKGAARNANRTA